VVCLSYCFITDEVRFPILTWRPSEPVPPEIIEAAADPDTCIVAHNDAFERQIEQHILHPRYGWPLFPLERRRCTQASALSFALPADLDKAAAALKLPIRKTAAGKKAMKKLAAPRKPRKGEDPTGIYWHDDPKDLATLEEYNRIDVEITDRRDHPPDWLHPTARTSGLAARRSDQWPRSLLRCRAPRCRPEHCRPGRGRLEGKNRGALGW
jgi:hypothetical protein